MSTKEEEIKALAKIKKIVADLGENSYVGTALDGALSLAEENIDCDAAFSSRYYQDELLKAEAALKAAEEKNAELVRAYEQISKKVLSHDDLEAIKKLVANYSSSFLQELTNAAERVVDYADDPTGIPFRNAVQDHRRAKQLMTQTDELLKRLCVISDED
ncbi:MAG: hypothetical protein OSJ43_12410 [Oscillospiraceae bacterium]|nr:hypothetical protein [Oscillospiraceae bacterium]